MSEVNLRVPKKKEFKGYFEKFFKYRYLLKELVVKDVKVKYRRSVLGLAWSVLNPLLMMLVITAVFSRIFKMNIENFPAYYIVGSLIFNFNSEATVLAMNSIRGASGLIKKVYIPKYIFPLEKVVFINCSCNSTSYFKGSCYLDNCAVSNPFDIYFNIFYGTGVDPLITKCFF